MSNIPLVLLLHNCLRPSFGQVGRALGVGLASAIVDVVVGHCRHIVVVCIMWWLVRSTLRSHRFAKVE